MIGFCRTDAVHWRARHCAATAPRYRKRRQPARRHGGRLYQLALLEQNRFLLRIEDEGVAQAVAQSAPDAVFVANANRDLVADTTTATARLVAEWVIYAGNSRRLGIEAARETVLAARQGLVSVEQQVLFDAVTAYLNVWRDLAGGQCARGQCPRRDATAARRPRPVRGRRGHPHRRRPGRGAAGAGALRLLAAAQGQLQISRELFALAIGRHPGALSGPGALPGSAAQRGRGRRARAAERPVDPAPSA
jgi:outer membrane protein